MTTALAETEYVKQTFEYGCNAYVAKPIDKEKIEEFLNKLELL